MQLLIGLLRVFQHERHRAAQLWGVEMSCEGGDTSVILPLKGIYRSTIIRNSSLSEEIEEAPQRKQIPCTAFDLRCVEAGCTKIPLELALQKRNTPHRVQQDIFWAHVAMRPSACRLAQFKKRGRKAVEEGR